MKKILAFAILLSCTTLFAQSKHEKIKALKVAHISEQLDLTAQEAEQFWPIYNVYEEKMYRLRKRERHEIVGKVKKEMATMTNSEASSLISKSIEIKKSELEVYSKLVQDLEGIIPPKKIIFLRKAEEDFKRQLLERYRNKKGKR